MEGRRYEVHRSWHVILRKGHRVLRRQIKDELVAVPDNPLRIVPDVGSYCMMSTVNFVEDDPGVALGPRNDKVPSHQLQVRARRRRVERDRVS